MKDACKYEHNDFDWVDYGSTRVQMPCFECLIFEDESVPSDTKDKVEAFIDKPFECCDKCPGYKQALSCYASDEARDINGHTL